MTTTTAPLGSFEWVAATGGQLTAADRRRLLRPLAAVHAANAVGRAAMLIHLNSGRRADIDPASLRPPTSALASAAQHEARSRLSPALLNHSYRTYAFGVALGALANIGVDRELLFAAAMLHDTGLARPVDSVDFTFASAHVATDVAETVGLSTVATQTIRTAITLHYSPGSHSPTARSPICWPRAPEWTSPGCGPGNCHRVSLPPSSRSGRGWVSSGNSPQRFAPKPPPYRAVEPASYAATGHST
jgi:hypothetical protein